MALLLSPSTAGHAFEQLFPKRVRSVPSDWTDPNFWRQRALKEAEGLRWLEAASGYRPAKPSARHLTQRIPHRIVQIGRTFESAMRGKNADFMRGWWEQNPDYAYAFFNDSHARNYVLHRATPEEANAYLCLLYTSPSPRDYAASRMPSSA